MRSCRTEECIYEYHATAGTRFGLGAQKASALGPEPFQLCRICFLSITDGSKVKDEQRVGVLNLMYYPTTIVLPSSSSRGFCI